jgi:hypothetical protein
MHQASKQVIPAKPGVAQHFRVAALARVIGTEGTLPELVEAGARPPGAWRVPPEHPALARPAIETFE